MKIVLHKYAKKEPIRNKWGSHQNTNQQKQDKDHEYLHIYRLRPGGRPASPRARRVPARRERQRFPALAKIVTLVSGVRSEKPDFARLSIT